MNVRLVFSRPRTLLSYAIATWLSSLWSHVSCVIGDEAWESSASTGVIEMPAYRAYSVNGPSAVAVVMCDSANAQAFLREQVGKPYDYTALFGIFAKRDWQEPDSWFCSELAAAAALAGGEMLVRKPINRITPEDLWSSMAARC
ncbi:MAG: hypothetical protein MUF54_00140 [Polyangiaceae bacterium]|jgi:uncharacterized protein YycO|nr:hypothetical protein [Polyangiaceae bacterium]